MIGKEFSKEEIIRIAEFFRLGYYKTNEAGQFLECDEHARGIFGIPKEETNLSKYNIAKLYEVPSERESRIKRIIENKLRPYSDTLIVLIGGKKKILFDVCWSDNRDNIHGLVREMEESSLLHYVRAVERMPTGFYSIEHAENDENHEHERITQCNDRFVEILGLKSKEYALGKNIVKLFHTPEIKKRFFKDLYETDKENKPLLNYHFETKRLDGELIHISMDVHLVRDGNGEVVGREGTIRGITKEIELRNKLEESRKKLERTTTDINKFVHTFLHPVVKFAGNSELLHQVGDLLQKTRKSEKIQIPESKELGGKLIVNLSEIRDKLPDIDERIENKGPLYKKDKKNLLKINALKEKLTKIIHLFDYSLKTEESDLLLDNTIRDTALWALDELNKIDFQQYSELRFLIQEGYIEFLHSILFSHLVHITKIMKQETEMMKNEVKSLRGIIGLQKERKYSLVKTDLRRILEENIERFKPVFSEKGIGIEYSLLGNLEAEISINDINRVICNLLDNAKKYSYFDRGFAWVRAKEIQPGDTVEISIENMGIPIKKEEIESGKIWELGYRGESTYSSDRDGSGVGLFEAKEVIEAHGGTICITSKTGRMKNVPPRHQALYTTTVTIRIPKKAQKMRCDK
jgi:PAS domain S-box-containing protein